MACDNRLPWFWDGVSFFRDFDLLRSHAAIALVFPGLAWWLEIGNRPGFSMSCHPKRIRIGFNTSTAQLRWRLQIVGPPFLLTMAPSAPAWEPERRTVWLGCSFRGHMWRPSKRRRWTPSMPRGRSYRGWVWPISFSMMRHHARSKPCGSWEM